MMKLRLGIDGGELQCNTTTCVSQKLPPALATDFLRWDTGLGEGLRSQGKRVSGDQASGICIEETVNFSERTIFTGVDKA